MNVLNLAKSAVTLVSSIGVGAVVTNAIKATTPGDLSQYQKLSIAVGSAVIGALVSKQATTQTSEEFDKVAATVRDFKNARKNTAQTD